MARLPKPGGDDGDWGNVLNTFLTVSHDTDGTLKNGIVSAAKLSAGSPTNGQVLGYNGSALAWVAPAAGTTGKADDDKVVHLTGNETVAGIKTFSSSPVVPTPTAANQAATKAYVDSSGGGAGKADDDKVVHLTGNEVIAGTKNFTGTLQTAGQAVVATNDVRMTNTRIPNDGSVTAPKLSAGTAANGQFLSYDGGNLVWATSTATGTVSDAAPGTKGIVALSGDLAGTAGTPTVPGLATKANDNVVVHLATAESITGVKTFTVSPVVPTPTTANQAATKAYVDSAAGSGGAPATASALGTIQLTGALGGTATNPTVPGLTSKVDTTDPRLTDTRTPKTASITPAMMDAVAAPANGQVLSYNGTKLNWVAPAAGGGSNGYAFTLRNISDQSAITAAAFDVIIVRSAQTSKLDITLPAATLNATVRIKRMAPTGNSVEVWAPTGKFIDAPAVGTHMLNTMYDSQDFWSDGLNWYRV